MKNNGTIKGREVLNFKQEGIGQIVLDTDGFYGIIHDVLATDCAIVRYPNGTEAETSRLYLVNKCELSKHYLNELGNLQKEIEFFELSP
jgi:trehalose utilization protein